VEAAHRTIGPAPRPLQGRIRVPGDKSISHRAVLFAAMSDGGCYLAGTLDSADLRSTISAVEELGAAVSVVAEHQWGRDLHVRGWGSVGPMQPHAPIDCGNSGTTARLLAGVVAGWPITATLVGDESLSGRPMKRIMEPLSLMGAQFVAEDGDRLPLIVEGGDLRAISYDMPVASAQVKSAILLAGVRAEGRTVVREPAPSRDHTERLLPAFGVGVGRDAREGLSWVDGPATMLCTDIRVPGDPSSAAFLICAASIVPGSEVSVPDVSLNPTRTGFLEVLRRMGADVWSSADEASGAEPMGPIRARAGSPLSATRVEAHEVPALIDEVPILALVATQAEGTTRFEGIGELRVKESDRLAAVADGLTALGASVREGDDWLEVDGPTRLRGAHLNSLGDHRLAMAWAIAGLVAEGPVTIGRWDAIEVSYPRFEEDLRVLGAF
jgi:3-phosphoshikimate 1-carboxyvinyltransferase